MIRPVLVRRENPLPGGQPLAFLVGLIVALLLGAVLLWIAGDSPVDVYEKMFTSAFWGTEAWSRTLNRAVPLGLAGLAVAVAGTMGLWNIGAEGQILFGATAAAWVAQIGDTWSGPVLIIVMMLAASVAGGLWAAGPAAARAYIGVNEIITTLMLNEIAIRLIRYLVNGPWKDPAAFGFAKPKPLPDQAALPDLFAQSNIGVIIALVVLLFLGLALSRTSWGYELKIAGSSGATATYAGISLKKKVLTVVILSGAVAGLAGGIELSGTTEITEGISNGYGYAGIIVAALALMRPSGVIAVALLFGGVQVGGQAIKAIQVSDSVATLLQGFILFGVIAAGVLISYRIELAEPKQKAAA